jgi:hypothetical protein
MALYIDKLSGRPLLLDLNKDVNLYAYGFEFTPGQTSETVTAIGNDSLRRMNWVTGYDMIYPALVEEDKTTTKLNPDNRTQLLDGSAADLTGASGDVMAVYEDMYMMFRYDAIRNKNQYWFSRYPLDGFTYYPKHAVGLYKANIDGVTGKLHSISGVTPTTNKNMPEYRAAAVLKGSGWAFEPYWMYELKYWLFVLETLNLNAQSALGEGGTNADSTKWNNYNGRSPVWTTDGGSASATGGGTVTATPGDPNASDIRNGQIPIEVTDFDGVTLNTNMARLHWQNDVFGHLWEYKDGVFAHYSTDDGARVFVNKNIATFADDTFSNYDYLCNIAQSSGYVSKFIQATMMPEFVLGASDEHCGDYHYTSSDQNGGFRGVRVGGGLFSGVNSGLAYFLCCHSPSYRVALIGSRLFLQY